MRKVKPVVITKKVRPMSPTEERQFCLVLDSVIRQITHKVIEQIKTERQHVEHERTGGTPVFCDGAVQHEASSQN